MAQLRLVGSVKYAARFAGAPAWVVTYDSPPKLDNPPLSNKSFSCAPCTRKDNKNVVAGPVIGVVVRPLMLGRGSAIWDTTTSIEFSKPPGAIFGSSLLPLKHPRRKLISKSPKA